MYFSATLGAFILFLLLLYKWFTGNKYRLLPGPSGLPFIGVIHKLDPTSPHKTFTEWAKQYGSIYAYKLLGRDIVMLNSYELIYEALVTRSEVFAGRPSSSLFRFMELHNHSDTLVMSYSERWKCLKKLTMQSLKMYGNNLKTLETITLDLTKDILIKYDNFAASNEAFDPAPLFYYLTSSIMLSILYGRKLDQDSLEEFLKQLDYSQKVFSPDPEGIALDLWPFLRHTLLRRKYAELVRYRQSFHDAFDHEYSTSKKMYKPGEPGCLIYALLDYKNKITKNFPNLELTDEDIISILMDLINAGTVTTTITLTVLIAVLVNKPDLQQKLADEIHAAIGQREPKLADRGSIPYVDAVIFETLRYNSQLPTSLAHCTVQDTSIGGYDIPKDTMVQFNLWRVHHDEEFWEEPWEFKPERFLDEDGGLLSVDHPNRQRLLPFGAGRRVCVGEVLAKNRLFLVVTLLLQNYVFLPESNDKRPLHHPMDYETGFNVYPKAYKIKVLKRVPPTA